MIRFACRCKHIIELPDEMAGRQVQCPHCQLLADVPSQDELAHMSEDGTYLVDKLAEQPERFQELRRVYAKKRVDEDGVEIDLRLTREQVDAAGTEELTSDAILPPTAPKYDPETGELVRPLDVQPDTTVHVHPSQIPMAQTALNYARPDMNPSTSIFRPLVQLVMPINLAAMFFVLMAHVFLLMAMFSLLLAAVAIVLVGLGLVAHYANVIEEVGIEERDELPRFLRHFNITDDVWLPFARVMLAWMICFSASRIVQVVAYVQDWRLMPTMAVCLSLDILGLILFPVVVLTTTTSGSLTNLRPDRLLGTMAQIGVRYALFVILYAVAISMYYFGLVAVVMHAFSVILWTAATQWYFRGPAAYGSLILAIYLMHYFAWLLGLTYRTEHQKFPWVLQGRDRVIPGVNAPRWAKPFRPANAGAEHAGAHPPEQSA